MAGDLSGRKRFKGRGGVCSMWGSGRCESPGSSGAGEGYGGGGGEAMPAGAVSHAVEVRADATALRLMSGHARRILLTTSR